MIVQKISYLMQKSAKPPRMMPYTTIKTVFPFLYGMFPSVPREFCHDRNHPFLLYVFFKYKLMVPDTDIGSIRLYPDNPVQNKFSVRTAIEGQIVFPQSFRQRRQSDRVPSLPEHGEHTDAMWRKGERPARFQTFIDHRKQVIQLYFIFTQENSALSAFRQKQQHASPRFPCPHRIRRAERR